MIRKYDHIFFDLDHTLWDFESNSREALRLTLEKHNLLYQLPSFDEFVSVYEAVNSRLWDDYREKKISKFLLTSQRFSMSLDPFEVKDYDSQELNDCYLDFMAGQTGLYPRVMETLWWLKTRGYQIHIITNGFQEVQYKKLKSSGLDQFISRVFISEVVQSPKPERAIFEYALKSCNAKKTRSIMVGDNWEVDIVGALNFGIDQVMFLNDGRNKVPEEIGKQLDVPAGELFIWQKRNKTFFIEKLEEMKRIV
ncbi:MAG: YjjG family noncanonical pyrimidine nucleotidase [Prolixibacteraceae bacterium]|jgi:putative hydrolase of the HAD superfamily|nr:YjjG family noncanonical pyrimidine nucleotidase [Prolixibacteraceae bacterium]